MLVKTLFLFVLMDGIANIKTDNSCNKKLGLDYLTPINERLPDDKLSASTERHYCLAQYGRLNFPAVRRKFGVWCPKDDDPEPWFQVDFGKMTTVRKVTLGTNVDMYQYTKSYTVSYRYKNSPWFTIKDKNGNAKEFLGIYDIYYQSTADLGAYITAQYFRIYPKTKFQNYCMQLELRGCFPGKDCNISVGVANPSIISDGQFTSSSVRKNHHAKDARLNNKPSLPTQWGAWCAQENDKTPWLQVDLKTVREISGVSTQGHPYIYLDAWTTQYKVNYSSNGIRWTRYGNGKVLPGNIDINSIVTTQLRPTIFARYIKVMPVDWNRSSVPCFRIEIYECLSRRESIPSLIKGLADTTIKRGEEFTLECVFRGQPRMQLEWHKDGHIFNKDDRITTMHSDTTNNITGLLQFQRITAKDDASFSCLAWYPGLMDTHAKSGSIITVLYPIPILNIVNVSSNFVLVNLAFIEPFTKDVKGFVIKIKHSDLPPDRQIIPVDTKLLNNTKSMLHKLSPLRPFSKYVFEIAMLYIGDELGEFTSQRNIFTLQDVPYGAPLLLQVERLSPKTLGCTWSLPESTLCNGPIIGYQVRYIKSVEKGGTEIAESKKLNETALTLYNLEAGAIYQVSVQAYTKIGPGPYNYPATLIFTGKATAELSKINKMLITKRNAAAVSYRLQNITSDRKNLNKHDVELTIDILEKVVSVENTTDIGESLTNIVSNVLKANKSVLAESEMTNRTGTRYVKVLEKWLENVDSKDRDVEEDSDNVIIKKVFWHKDRIEEEIKFAEEAAEIRIPAKILRKKNSTEDVSIYFVFYKNNKFFRKPKVVELKCINGFTVTKERSYTPVISGDIVGSESKNLSEPIILKFKMNTNVTLEESACVYWDFKANNGKGNWSTKGCKVHSIVGRTIECHCNHLTNFAAMMDIYAHTSKICGQHQEIISYITIIGCFLSLIGLFVTFLTYFMFKSLHQELSAKVLVQLCISLFIVVLTFIIGIEQVHRPKLCVAVAISLHYFTLVSFLWMMIEAILMYYSFVKVWPPREGGDIYKSSIVAWGIPLVIVLTAYLTNQDNYSGKHYCHVTGIILYATYLAPMGIVISTNFILFICIMYGLSTRPNNNIDRSYMEDAFIRCRRAFGIMILMGLTWSFGFGLGSKARLLFSYLFAISNGLQGFAIFIFYCAAQKNARNAWKQFLTCDRRSKHERNTESYSERLRLSSAASTRTQLRANSDSSTLLRVNKTGSTNNICNSSVLQPFYKEQSIEDNLNNIIRMTPPRSPKPPTVAPMALINIDKIVCDEANNLMSTPADDEILDKRLEEEAAVEEPKPQPKLDLKKYSSYRALSGPTSYDVFSLVKTPSAKSLHKDSLHRKSAEFINRKTLDKNRLNRNSMIESSSLSSHHKQRMRSVKSMEQVNKGNKESFCDSNDNDVSLTDMHRNNTILVENDPDDVTIVTSDEKTLGSESDTADPIRQTYTVNVGTMKSDATTMTDMNELTTNALLRNPLYGFKMDSHRSPNDILQWLHEGNDPTKSDGTDSDYSSTYYKTSRSSSMTDLHGPLRSSASESSKPNKKKTKEKELLDNMVLAPLKGTRNNSKGEKRNIGVKRYSHRSSGKSDSEDRSELSEAGYSASEEDLVDNGQFINRTKSRRRKIRRRSTNLSKVSQYVSLEEPSAHVSFV